MKCADPVLCYTIGNSRKFRHFSLASPVAKLFHDLVFNCGKCIFCRKKKSYELAIRCVLHASLYQKNCFLTLTYDETQLGYHNTLAYDHIQKFKKRLRQDVNTVYYSHIKTRKLKKRRVPKNYAKKIEIFNVHEYGKNGKKHWHLVVFNHDFTDKKIFTKKNEHNLYTSGVLETLWPYGFSTIGDVSEASAMYQAQYMEKDIKNRNMTNGKKSKSKHSGIGKQYFLKYYKQILTLGYIPFSGKKIPLPRYFHKISHRHYCHYYDPTAFTDILDRKRLYRPFTNDSPNLELANLFKDYLQTRTQKIQQLTEEWENVITPYLYNHEKPDFMKSAENYLYDLNNKNKIEKF